MSKNADGNGHSDPLIKDFTEFNLDPVQIIRVGEFKIKQSRSRRGRFLIAHDDGEVMETTEVKLAKAIRAFWRKEF